MEQISRAFYELTFKLAFIEKKGQEFEDFFSEIMEKRHPCGDFIRVRPWGNTGDRKNDGYLKSERRLYQVYAPNEISAAKAIAKINKDFNEAIPYWKDHFDHWHFVHNSREGLSPQITKRILELDCSNDVSVLPFGFEDLRTKFFELTESDIVHIVGRAPGPNNFSDLSFTSFKSLLGNIVVNEIPSETDLRPVPGNKLAINSFSEHIKLLIKFGLRKTKLVRDFFKKWPDAIYGDQITKAISDKYKELKATALNQNDIFLELRKFVIGELKATSEVEAAALVVLSYFFEECDIFEREGR